MGVMAAMVVGVDVWWMVRLILCVWVWVKLGTVGLGLVIRGFEVNVLRNRHCMRTAVSTVEGCEVLAQC